MKDKMNKFSVSLGLFDYINPIFYTITSITIMLNMFNVMDKPLYTLYIIGAIVSIIFGLTIPTVKVLVGLGKFSFKMPVNLVFYVNTGIYISGLALLTYLFNISLFKFIFIILFTLALLALMLYKSKKFNTVAVLIGAFGYILLYFSLINTSLIKALYLPLIMYIIAICLFIFLALVGIMSDLKNPRVHWVIEISNVLCQGLVAIATILLFK